MHKIPADLIAEAARHAAILIHDSNDQKSPPRFGGSLEQHTLRKIGEYLFWDEIKKAQVHIRSVPITENYTKLSADDDFVLVAHKCNVPILTDDGKGKGSGLRMAFVLTSPDDVIFVDPDMTYPLYAIPSFIAALKDHDLVIGERTAFKPGSIPLSFRISDWLSRRLFRIIYGQKLDNLSGFRGLSRSAIEKMDLQEDGFGIETEITAKAVRLGLRIKSIPIHYYPREGKSKFRPIRDSLVVIRAMLRYRNWKP